MMTELKNKMVLFFCLGLNAAIAQDTPAYETTLNYDVPESPAFSILDLNPSKVMRGSNAKALTVDIANQIASQEKISSGIALDLCPLQAFATINQAFLGSQPSYLYRLFNYTQVSFATVQAGETDDLIYGIGIRMTLFDTKDLLRKANLSYRQRISTALNPQNHPTGEGSDEFVRGRSAGLAEEMVKIKEELRTRQGISFTVGYANSGNITEGEVKPDTNTISVKNHQAWGSLQFQSNIGIGLNLIFLGRYGVHYIPSSIVGIAARCDNLKINYSLEFINDFTKKQSSLGGIIEIKASKSIDILFNVSGSNQHNADPSDKKLYLNIKPTIRYVLAG